MKQRIVLATSNPSKVKEFQEILGPLGYEVVTPASLGIVSDPVEDGLTYRENALIKARDVARQCALPVIADDSGIEMEGMDNAPGIHTARFSKAHGGYPAVFATIFAALQGKSRKAAYHCAICYLSSADAEPLYFEGVCPGSILEEPRGDHGFGYDPIFHSDEANEDFGLASEETKNLHSHRGKASRALVAYLSSKKLEA